MTPLPMIRSALFVPAARPELLTKAHHCEADAVIVDLEDSVPAGRKSAARHALAEHLEQESSGAICVRVNPPGTNLLSADLAVATHARVTAVMVPKVRSAEEVVVVAEALARQEEVAGLPLGSVRIWPIVETAQAVRNAFEIAAASPRVAYMGGGTSRGGDLAFELGYAWTAAGLETLYVRSKVLVDVRAAGVPNPVTGVVTDVSDLAAVREFATQSRGLGYEGAMVIHPSHVAVVNQIFSPDATEISAARAVIEALSRRQDIGAVRAQGHMVDAAMMQAALRTLERARACGADTGPGD